MNRSLSMLSVSACAAAAACLLVAAPARAQQADAKQNAGEARVVQRQALILEIERQQRPVAAVVFPSQSDSGLEVSVLESDPKNPAADREAIFAARDAQQKGVITSDFGQNGNARRLMITARRQGAPVQVQELAANGTAHVYVVRREQPKPDVAQNQQKPQQGQQANGQQPAGAQQGGAQQANAQQANAQQASAQQTPPQPQQPQEKPATPEQNDAVIFVYLSGQK